MTGYLYLLSPGQIMTQVRLVLVHLAQQKISTAMVVLSSINYDLMMDTPITMKKRVSVSH